MGGGDVSMTTVGRWSPNKVRARVLDGTWVSAEELGGMVLLTPTSIAYTGTSASIGANGSVEFTAVTSLELRGVFSADYDNYMIAMTAITTGNDSQYWFQLLSGTTPATGTDYTHQYLVGDGSTVGGGRTTSDTSARLAAGGNVARGGDVIYFYGPYLTQPTAMRNVSAQNRSGGIRILDNAATHSLSTSYDGFNWTIISNTTTGLISVYGLVGA